MPRNRRVNHPSTVNYVTINFQDRYYQAPGPSYHGNPSHVPRARPERHVHFEDSGPTQRSQQPTTHRNRNDRSRNYQNQDERDANETYTTDHSLGRTNAHRYQRRFSNYGSNSYNGNNNGDHNEDFDLVMDDLVNQLSATHLGFSACEIQARVDFIAHCSPHVSSSTLNHIAADFARLRCDASVLDQLAIITRHVLNDRSQPRNGRARQTPFEPRSALSTRVSAGNLFRRDAEHLFGVFHVPSNPPMRRRMADLLGPNAHGPSSGRQPSGRSNRIFEL